MTEMHPMIPPSEELKQWEDNWFDEEEHPDVLLIRAYQAGADAELEACCKVLDNLNDGYWSEELRAARRPKPLSLKQQALIEFDSLLGDSKDEGAAIILRALGALPDD
jgi:hypothetical protein